MIQEAYASFSTAKLLKEKGFKERVVHYYRLVDGGLDFPDEYCCYDWNNRIGCVSAPTQQMAMRWIREKHGLFISVNFVSEEPFSWKSAFDYTVRKADGDFNKQSDFYKTYEEACEEAIKYCMENLI